MEDINPPIEFENHTFKKYYYTSQGQWVNTLRLRKKWLPFRRRHFHTHLLQLKGLNFDYLFVPNGPINDIPALVQIMAWLWPGDKPYLSQCWLVHWRIYASLGLHELTHWTKWGLIGSIQCLGSFLRIKYWKPSCIIFVEVKNDELLVEDNRSFR